MKVDEKQIEEAEKEAETANIRFVGLKLKQAKGILYDIMHEYIKGRSHKNSIYAAISAIDSLIEEEDAPYYTEGYEEPF